MIVTSSLDSARGLFSDYGRARCTGGGATAASIKADTMRELQRGRSRLCGAGKTTGYRPGCSCEAVTESRWQDSPRKPCLEH